ncbi:hypothetical protein PVAP13_2KG411666 [Panicum virgatum]|uniref:Uncharacterized protein n=1 Tax=Panicum virgatum TaxID=38727 RepID=A0A8T0WMM0_PANVG|nr:hypothetical protein PVAP13_2KG411666 [Panicum virgatum]
MARFEMSLPPRGKHASPSSALPKWTASLHGVGAVLAELDAWPDLQQAMRTTLAAHATAVTALVLRARRELSWDIRWITRHRDVLESEARRHLAMPTLPVSELIGRRQRRATARDAFADACGARVNLSKTCIL